MLDASLGFAAGVMLAASYWSLLAPALELAAEMPMFGEAFSFVPVAFGFLLGALFVFGSDLFLTRAGLDNPMNLILSSESKKDCDNFDKASSNGHSSSGTDARTLGECQSIQSHL